MNYKIILNLAFLYAGLFSFGQELDPKEILKQSADKLRENTLYNYEAKYRIKYFDNNDTTELSNYKCTIMKSSSDTILNYYAKVYNENEERIYDGKNLLLIWHDSKSIIKRNPHVIGKDYILNNLKREHIPHFFYSKNPFNYNLTKATKMNLSDTSIEGKKVWKIEISLPTDEEITSFTEYLYIDKSSLFPVKIELFAKFQDIQDQYSELILNNIIASKSLDNDFSGFYKYPVGYEEEIRNAPNIDFKLLSNGTKFIPFTGVNISNKFYSIDSNSIENKLILIDFWYVACAPCIRAMPILARISNDYKGQGLEVLGLNPIDSSSYGMENIKKFAAKYNVNYQLLTIDKDISDAYLINSYPTLYLIKNGTIIYSHIGYSEDKMRELEQFIISNL